MLKSFAQPLFSEKEIEADIMEVYNNRPRIAMVDSDKGITNLHAPNDVIIDASVPPVIRDSGMMWNWSNELEDTKMLIPDRSYAPMYQAIVEDCQKNGKLDVATMGNVPNVGLMAQKAQEDGSHDKTFEIPETGVVRVVDNNTNLCIFEHSVEKGDIWRACQTKDSPIQDWINLAVSRARATGNAYFLHMFCTNNYKHLCNKNFIWILNRITVMLHKIFTVVLTPPLCVSFFF